MRNPFTRRQPRLILPRARPAGWRRTRTARWGRGELRAAAFWIGAFAVLAGGYGVAAPLVDDWRSGQRAMSPDCRVSRVIDGDTVELSCRGEDMGRARIVGYDAPELFSPGCEAEAAAAEAARARLAALAHGGGRTEVAVLGRDKYDRALVDLRVGGERVATRMVAEGHGRRYLGGLRGGWCA